VCEWRFGVGALHDAMIHDLAISKKFDNKSLLCVHCHATVGHGERTGMGRFEKFEFSEEDKK
jgi:hypothetical protein